MLIIQRLNKTKTKKESRFNIKGGAEGSAEDSFNTISTKNYSLLQITPRLQVILSFYPTSVALRSLLLWMPLAYFDYYSMFQAAIGD